jgi:hypothetical protein
MASEEHIDHYRRERSRNLLAASKEVVPSLEQSETQSSLVRSRSSPNLFEQAQAAGTPKVPAFPRVKASSSFTLPRIRTVSVLPQSQLSDKADDLRSPSTQTIVNVPSWRSALSKYADKLHFLLPDHLAYAALSPAEISSLKDDSQYLNVTVVSSYLHRQYVPLCADFGPVTINVVHRFCQVLQ